MDNIKKLKMPHAFWNDGYRCGVNVYTELLYTLLQDLAIDRKRLTPSILQKFNDLMLEHRVDVNNEYYNSDGFKGNSTPFIRVNRSLSDKKITVIEWYDPKANIKVNK